MAKIAEINANDVQLMVNPERLSISECVRISKSTGSDVVRLLMAYYAVDEVPV